jgi:hypothetical protein
VPSVEKQLPLTQNGPIAQFSSPPQISRKQTPLLQSQKFAGQDGGEVLVSHDTGPGSGA